MLAAFAAGVKAQDFTPVLNDIINSYSPWKSAEFSGKVKADALPVSVTVKMFMVNDSLLQVSARVPLMGEVGRLTLTKDRLLVVNKMKKTYCEESPDHFFELYPSFLADLQGLFLGRIVILGDGELDADNVEVVDVQSDGAGSWLVIPQTDSKEVPFTYGYLVGANSRTKALVGAMSGKGTVEVQYSYRDRGEQMDVTIEGKKKRNVRIEFSSVKWGGTELSPLRTDNYQRMSLKEFLASLR